MNNDVIRPVLLVYWDDTEIKDQIVSALSSQIKVCVIETEFIRNPQNPFDDEDYAAYEKALKENNVQSITDKVNASITRTYAEKSYRLYIIALDKINDNDHIAKLLSGAKLSGDCRMFALTVEVLHRGNSFLFASLQSEHFEILSALFKSSTPTAKIIHSDTEMVYDEELYSEMTDGFYKKSPLILTNLSAVKSLGAYNPCTSFAVGHGYSIVKMHTAAVDTKKIVVTVNGKLLQKLPPVADSNGETGSTEIIPQKTDADFIDKTVDWFKRFTTKEGRKQNSKMFLDLFRS